MDVAGWLIVGTKMNNDKFEKQMTDLERKYANKEIDIDITTKEYENAEKELNRINDLLDKRIAREKEIETKLENEQNKQYKSQTLINLYKEQLANVIDEELKLYDAWDKQNSKMEKIGAKLEKQKNDLSTINGKIEQLKLEKIDTNVQKINKGMTSAVKKVGKWALAVFGLRSAYMAVRNAINVLTQDDAQLKADIDYIKTAFAYTLEPVVREIVGLAKQLMIFIQSIVYSLTGKNIFANANKGLEKANKSASELKKTLAGFDEMNILSDTSGGGGGATPSFDLSQIEDVDLSGIDRLGKKIKKMVDKIINGIVKNTSKVLKNLGFSDDYIKAWEKTWEAIKKIIDGAIDFIFGIIKMLVGFLTGNTEMVKEGFKQTIDGLKEIVFGFIDYMISLYEGAKQSIIDIITRIGEWFTKKFNEMGDKFDDWKKQFEEKWDKLADKIKDKIDKLKDRLKEKFGTIGEVVGEAIGGALKNAINRAFDRVEWLLNTPINTINSLITKIRKLPGFKDLGYISTFSLPRLAKGGIINMPNRGVPVGSAIAGEKGAEGVIPLTDSQQMALLGEAIGKYISINATVPVYVGNRMVARELKRINAEDNFAYNR